jgi:hypothetical protein
MSDPHPCPHCDKIFAWGEDADSDIVKNPTCRANAHWKLSDHMAADHADQLFVCGRQTESHFGDFGLTPQAYWRKDGTCSYCGSLSPAELFAAIDAGAELGPTDKSYKLYVTVPHPQAGETIRVGSSSGPTFNRNGDLNIADATDEEKATGRYERISMGTAPATRQAKFYFQHFDEADCQRFIDLLNAKKLNLGVPGYFYARPFFIAPPAAAPIPTA